MQLDVVGTGSAGNCYVFTANDGRRLIIEAGMRYADVAKVINFDPESVDGVLISHSHGDHCKHATDFLNKSMNLYMSDETIRETGLNHHRIKTIESRVSFKVGKWMIMPFEVKHDVKCLGFLLYHPECGKTLFLTDTYYCKYVFHGLNNIIIEANYSRPIIDQKYGPESDKEFLRNRILRSHFSLENCLGMLAANDLTSVNNIVLIHLSDTNSNEIEFQRQVQAQTGKTVTCARNGMKMPFDKTPF